ncbi:Inositolphosphorylceramide synthase subunit Kei1-domain-containing protein [Pseudomassariella vexata]|uniref:Inositolphosphorylceramide synthase subunit Kei1-domain-containing protein n=1 Tax=Pseudomassariella vexata TaxID=1141098 RepID=A0A1Y2EG69_9PEZI|nr:Inositolphosphorylceramide synthase subunit Kei1-domain-containing protein [Pseudomassariella vexata]ORY70417.1 Inositolphosphorylceramide synthase subunit Kei1-domain-containing protein [Pseudomassariella vexata]
MASSKGLQLRLPRPQNFLGLISLQTGTELIALALLFNKVTGLYGLLAILTGYHISILQLSLYIYSTAALILLAFCMPHIRKQTPFQCVALAWLYVIDTFINTAYTTAFAVTWYLANGSGVAGKKDDIKSEDPDQQPGAEGFMGAVDTTTSMTLIVLFTLVRVYFMLVVMAHVRLVLLQYTEGREQGFGDDAGRANEGLFAEDSPEGAGWRGKVGRAMISVGRSYWVGPAEGDEWTRSMKGKFSNQKVIAA